MINSEGRLAAVPRIADLGFVAGVAVIWAKPSGQDTNVWNTQRDMSSSCGLPAYYASPPFYTSIMLELSCDNQPAEQAILCRRYSGHAYDVC
jgi:hypothetical protein